MQRPILVLVLVLAAIVALLFGVFSLLKDPTEPHDGAPVAQKPVEGPRNTKPADLSSDENRGPRNAAPQGPEREVPEDQAGFQYDNQLVGEVVDKESKPVAGAELVLTPVGTQELFFVNDPVDHSKDLLGRSDKDGKFAFRNIEPRSKYRLIVRHQDFTRKELDTVPVYPQGVSQEPPITLTVGAQIVGHVKDEGGNPVPGAMVFLDGIQYQTSPYEPPDRMSAKAGNDGLYTLTNIPPGPRVLTVKAQGYGTVTVQGLSFQKDESLTREVTLKVAEMICGRVVGPGNAGIADATVMAIGFSSTAQSARGEAKTNDKGEFCIESLMPGPYNVLATCRGWRFEKAMRVNSNTSNVVIEAFKEADACGMVVDAESGKPISSFKVRLRIAYPGNPATQPIPDSETVVSNASNGEFCIPGVQASGDGGYVVEAQAPGYAPGFSPIFSISPGKSVSGVEVRLGHGGTLTGRVVDSDGKPVARALVTTHDNEWTMDAFTEAIGAEYPTQATSASARTNAQGVFTIKNLTPETYQITIEAAGHTAFEQKDVAVGVGQANNMGDVRLGKGGSIQGRLVDPSGKVVSGGRVELSILEGDRPRSYRAKTAGDGTYVITNIFPGRYKLTGTANGDGGGNPFEDLMQQKNSERQINVAEGDAQRGVDVNLNQ